MKQYLLASLFLITTWGYTQTPPLNMYQENYQEPIEIGKHRFTAEVVSTPTLMQKGMMYRPQIKPDNAMLFVYEKPQNMSFWMKNMRIPLDILFFNAAGVLQEIKSNVPPCVSYDCPVYPAQHGDNQYVVEMKAGRAHTLGIQIGDVLREHFNPYQIDDSSTGG
ncbi:MAG: DUF192 domain-containing protein [Gammaproteobacteria bacterium]|nr:DUF192 domain-containing protein [Gammaproteobacteria bacterium]